MLRPFRFVTIAAIFAVIPGTVVASRRADGQLEIQVVDSESGASLPARMHLRNSRGRPVRLRQPGVVSRGGYFYFDGSVLLELGRGQYTFELDTGPEYRTRTGHFEIRRHAEDAKRIEMHRFARLAEEGWYAGDLRSGEWPLDETPLAMAAEQLHVLPMHLAETTVPPGDLVTGESGAIFFGPAGATFPLAPGCAMFGLAERPSVDQSAATPAVAQLIEGARRRGAHLVAASPVDRQLPLLLATGQIDAVQVLAPAELPKLLDQDRIEVREPDRSQYTGEGAWGRYSEAIYYKLLEAGLRISPAAGSWATEGSDRPIGAGRVYVRVGEHLTYDRWWESLQAGRVFVTNGPLLRTQVRGEPPGQVFFINERERLELEIGLLLDTRDKIDYLEIVKNGRVEFSIRLDEFAKGSGRLPPVQFTESGWFLLRAVTINQDLYQLAMTAPYYVEKTGDPRISRQAVQYFLDWIDEAVGQTEPGEQREAFLWARQFWQQRLERANAD